jgi:hypothetical protein
MALSGRVKNALLSAVLDNVSALRAMLDLLYSLDREAAVKIAVKLYYIATGEENRASRCAIQFFLETQQAFPGCDSCFLPLAYFDHARCNEQLLVSLHPSPDGEGVFDLVVNRLRHWAGARTANYR